MEELLGNLLTLGMLVLLQVVLGFDNLLYISLESKRAPADKQAKVRRLGIGLAVFLRIALLFILVKVIDLFQDPLFDVHWGKFVHGTFNLHSLIVLVGGVFIIYTATKEVMHMLRVEDLGHTDKKPASVGSIIFWIVAMNLVFSFDSILAAMALAKGNFWVMAVAIVIGGALMILLANRVATFLQKNRMYEVLGLFILFVVGIMLLTEGAHLAHLELFENAVMPMTKTTFYFVIGVLVFTDIVQSRYQKKLLGQNSASRAGGATTAP